MDEWCFLILLSSKGKLRAGTRVTNDGGETYWSIPLLKYGFTKHAPQSMRNNRKILIPQGL